MNKEIIKARIFKFLRTKNFVYNDRLFFALLVLALILDLAAWIYWKKVLNDTSKLLPILYTTGILIFNFILAVTIYKKEKPAAYLILSIISLAQILLLVLLRYYFLVSGLL